MWVQALSLIEKSMVLTSILDAVVGGWVTWGNDDLVLWGPMSAKTYSQMLPVCATILRMSIALTITIIVLLIGLGVLGVFRGVREGLLTLVGTLMAAALVDLWHVRLSEWLVEMLQDDRPKTGTWAVISLTFLFVALLVGYGSSTFLPKRPNKPHQKPLFKERLSGGLLGALNGAMIVSYLLRYTDTILQNKDFAAALQESVVARVLYAWLPWFVLAMVITVLINIIWRLVQRTLLASGQGQMPPPGGKGGKGGGGGGGGGGGNPPGGGGGAKKSQREQDQALLNKINRNQEN